MAKISSSESLIGDCHYEGEEDTARQPTRKRPRSSKRQKTQLDFNLMIPPINKKGSQIRIGLVNYDLWLEFSQHTTEMLVNKRGRNMFPKLEIVVSGLDYNASYVMAVDVVPIDSWRYKFCEGEWVVSRPASENHNPDYYVHPMSPQPGKEWMEQDISFGSLKLTNNDTKTGSMVRVNTMIQYQPRLHIIESNSIDLNQPEKIHVFLLQPTRFIPVTSYMNEAIINLKVKYNKYAKAFRSAREQRPSTGELDKEVRPPNGSDDLEQPAGDGKRASVGTSVDPMSTTQSPGRSVDISRDQFIQVQKSISSSTNVLQNPIGSNDYQAHSFPLFPSEGTPTHLQAASSVQSGQYNSSHESEHCINRDHSTVFPDATTSSHFISVTSPLLQMGNPSLLPNVTSNYRFHLPPLAPIVPSNSASISNTHLITLSPPEHISINKTLPYPMTPANCWSPFYISNMPRHSTEAINSYGPILVSPQQDSISSYSNYQPPNHPRVCFPSQIHPPHLQQVATHSTNSFHPNLPLTPNPFQLGQDPQYGQMLHDT